MIHGWPYAPAKLVETLSPSNPIPKCYDADTPEPPGMKLNSPEYRLPSLTEQALGPQAPRGKPRNLEAPRACIRQKPRNPENP